MNTESVNNPQASGGCMCGSARYTFSGPPLIAGLCHCSRCRPQSGSSFSAIIFLARANLKLVGPTQVFHDVGTSGRAVQRRFCPHCGSALTTEPDIVPELLMLKIGGLHDTTWFRPTIEIFVGGRQSWVLPVPGALQLAGNPSASDIGLA